jgi:sugar-specific transcriptional regulator TrmB
VQLSDQQKQYLRKIGLSLEAVRLYELLLQKGRMTAQRAASLTQDFPSAKYRLFYELENHQLVRRIPGRPRSFEPVALSLGLKASLLDNQSVLERLLDLGTIQKQPEDGMAQILIGRRALYEVYIRYASEAMHEIHLYSIGIAFSKELETVQRAAVRRGVSIKHVIQQRKLSNQHIISKWHRAGVRLRYLRQPRGFHFFVIDGTMACITFSDPVDTDNRLSIVTTNEAAIEMFTAQFQGIWQQAEVINN